MTAHAAAQLATLALALALTAWPLWREQRRLAALAYWTALAQRLAPGLALVADAFDRYSLTADQAAAAFDAFAAALADHDRSR